MTTILWIALFFGTAAVASGVVYLVKRPTDLQKIAALDKQSAALDKELAESDASRFKALEAKDSRERETAEYIAKAERDYTRGLHTKQSPGRGLDDRAELEARMRAIASRDKQELDLAKANAREAWVDLHRNKLPGGHNPPRGGSAVPKRKAKLDEDLIRIERELKEELERPEPNWKWVDTRVGTAAYNKTVDNWRAAGEPDDHSLVGLKADRVANADRFSKHVRAVIGFPCERWAGEDRNAYHALYADVLLQLYVGSPYAVETSSQKAAVAMAANLDALEFSQTLKRNGEGSYDLLFTP